MVISDHQQLNDRQQKDGGGKEIEKKLLAMHHFLISIQHPISDTCYPFFNMQDAGHVLRSMMQAMYIEDAEMCAFLETRCIVLCYRKLEMQMCSFLRCVFLNTLPFL